jgi:broad specificity phosphatase PhoE
MFRMILFAAAALFALPTIRGAMTTQPARSATAIDAPGSVSSTVRAGAGAGAGAGDAGWSDVAIKAAKDFTVSQRKKLHELGALDIQRPIRITGEPITINTTRMNMNIQHKNTNDEIENSNNENTNTKIIHFQRHSQGYHNLICDIWREKGLPIDFDSHDSNLNPVIRPEFIDPPLTETGRQQGIARRNQCASLSPQLLIVSPLLRCIQTAKLSFRDHGTDKIKWIAHEGCREELGLLNGNKRRPLQDIQHDYPDIDFTSYIEHDEDFLWDNYGDRRETLLEKSQRIYGFLGEFVRNRPEREIAIVSHSAYLFTLMNAVMDIEDEELRSWFLTSEVRSMKVTFEVHK